MGVSIKDYLDTPVFWTEWAAIAETAENMAQKMANDEAKSKH